MNIAGNEKGDASRSQDVLFEPQEQLLSVAELPDGLQTDSSLQRHSVDQHVVAVAVRSDPGVPNPGVAVTVLGHQQLGMIQTQSHLRPRGSVNGYISIVLLNEPGTPCS